jgi:hypothetical protein
VDDPAGDKGRDDLELRREEDRVEDGARSEDAVPVGDVQQPGRIAWSSRSTLPASRPSPSRAVTPSLVTSRSPSG